MCANQKSPSSPDYLLIKELKNIYQFERIVGLDEVGRGALAGPIVVAAVEINVPLPNICDSKKLSAVLRQQLASLIFASAAQISFGQTSNLEIDQLGLNQAQELAYTRALQNITADLYLTDFVRLAKTSKTIRAVRGDSLFYPVAAASIIGKIYRDKYMSKLSKIHPEYNWQTNVGYGTAEHREAIKTYGFCQFHRLSFKLK